MRATPLPYAALHDGDAASTAQLCEDLHERGYALVRFAPAAAVEVSAVRATAAAFFHLDAVDKAAIGDFRFVGDTYAGYRDSAACDAEFLEVHTNAAGGTYPPLAKPPGLSEAAAALHTRLDGMSRRILSILAAHIGVPDAALLSPLDPPGAPSRAERVLAASGAADQAELSASVLRVCHYRRRPGAVSDTAAAAEDDDAEVEVLFDAHTDSSLLTLSTLCPSAPGLQLQVDGKWVSVEQLDGVEECDVEVHVGDFLCFLSREYFPSCVHRVVRPASGPGRLSFPFLVRPRQEHVLDTLAYDPKGTNPRLVEVSGIKCRDLRKLFDVRGKRVKDEEEAKQRQLQRAAEEAEATRKARAAAFRAKLLANGGRLVDSSDEESSDADAANAAAPPAADAAEPSSSSPVRAAVVAAGAPRPPPRAHWALGDLASLRYSAEYLFVFKQNDLHMDHPEEPVTLATQLNHCHAELADKKCSFGFRHVHQLDYATSGVLCVALSKKAAGAAGKLFEQRRTSKLYLALVAGHPSWDHLSCTAAVGEDSSDPRGFRMAVEGQSGCSKPLTAHTDMYVIARGHLDGQNVAKLLMVPKSGRRHQLRVHSMASGHPIVGDVAYTGDARATRMMLHAWRLRLPLPKAAEPICVGTSDPFPFRRRPVVTAASAGSALPAIAARASALLAIGFAAVAVSSIGARARPPAAAFAVGYAAAISAAAAMAVRACTAEDLSGRATTTGPAAAASAAPRLGLDGSVRALPALASFAALHVLSALRTGTDDDQSATSTLQSRSAEVPPPPDDVEFDCVAPMRRADA